MARKRECDYCGAVITEEHYDKEKSNVPTDKGWCTISGRKLCELWKKDICPNCIKRLEGSS